MMVGSAIRGAARLIAGHKQLDDASRQDLRRIVDALLAAIALAALLAAYVMAPIVPLVDHARAMIGGIFVVAGSFALILARGSALPRPVMIIGALFLVTACYLLLVTASDALGKRAWNDRRCMRIQTAMLGSRTAVRPDLPELFMALGCKPQGSAPLPRHEGPAERIRDLASSPGRLADDRRAQDEELSREVVLDEPSTRRPVCR